MPDFIADEPFYYNGLHIDTGEYLAQAPGAAELSRLAKGIDNPIPDLDALQERDNNVRGDQQHFGVKYGIDPKSLAQTGWGVIFASNDPNAEKWREALKDLLTHRRAEAGDRYVEYSADAKAAPKDGAPKFGIRYRPGMSASDFLSANGAGPGLCDPAVVPYYLLIVGDPECIPFEFQYQLDVQYGVGRIAFRTAQEYENYARSVVLAESPDFAAPKSLALFGPAADSMTRLSSNFLLSPLDSQFQLQPTDWDYRLYPADKSDRAQLSRLLGGADTPALLLTASHGIASGVADARRFDQNGALVCADWPGLVPTASPTANSSMAPMKRNYYFAGEDISADARLLGLVAFHFACFGAGTPVQSDLFDKRTQSYPRCSDRPFVSRLPQNLLSHPKGGALAVAGHIDTATDFTFRWDGVAAGPSGMYPSQVSGTYDSILRALMDGVPLGFAFEYFNNRYAEMSTLLSAALTRQRRRELISDAYIASYWRATYDARNFVVLGDPAVRLKTSKTSTRQSLTISASIATETAGAAPAAAAQPAEQPAGQAEYWLTDSDTVKQVRGMLGDLCVKIGDVLAKAYDNVTTVEVETYTAADTAKVKVTDGSFDGATLRAVSRIGLDGRAKACIPVDAGGKPDETLWKLHSEMVDRALTQRIEILKLVSSAASQMMGSVKL